MKNFLIFFLSFVMIGFFNVETYAQSTERVNLKSGMLKKGQSIGERQRLYSVNREYYAV